MEIKEVASNSWVKTALFGAMLGVAYVAGSYVGAEIARMCTKEKDTTKDNEQEA